MSFKKSSLAVALLLVALMMFGGCGGGGGGDSPGPGPVPDPTDSRIDGTWRVSSISYDGESPLNVSSTPSKFPVRMIYDKSTRTYEAYVNDGTDVECRDSAGNDFPVSTVSGLTRIGSSEIYESADGTLELIKEDELVVEVNGVATITLTRAGGPGPDPESEINGTWKCTYTFRSYNAVIDAEGVPTTNTPETFPIEVIRNGDTYTLDVNNGVEVYWEYDGPSGYVGTTFRTTSGFIKVGDEKYEKTEGTSKTIIELTGTNTLTKTSRVILGADNDIEAVDIDTLTRQ